MAKFNKVERDCGFVWMHDSAPVWIVKYDAITTGPHRRAAFYQAYRAVQPVPKGRMPWSIDNRRIGTEDGFATLTAAQQAAV
jgi:hypothetical protein